MIRQTEKKKKAEKEKDYQEIHTKNSIVPHIVMTNRMHNFNLLCQEIEAHHKVISIHEQWKEYLHFV